MPDLLMHSTQKPLIWAPHPQDMIQSEYRELSATDYSNEELFELLLVEPELIASMHKRVSSLDIPVQAAYTAYLLPHLLPPELSKDFKHFTRQALSLSREAALMHPLIICPLPSHAQYKDALVLDTGLSKLIESYQDFLSYADSLQADALYISGLSLSQDSVDELYSAESSSAELTSAYLSKNSKTESLSQLLEEILAPLSLKSPLIFGLSALSSKEAKDIKDLKDIKNIKGLEGDVAQPAHLAQLGLENPQKLAKSAAAFLDKLSANTSSPTILMLEDLVYQAAPSYMRAFITSFEELMQDKNRVLPSYACALTKLSNQFDQKQELNSGTTQSQDRRIFNKAQLEQDEFEELSRLALELRDLHIQLIHTGRGMGIREALILSQAFD